MTSLKLSSKGKVCIRLISLSVLVTFLVSNIAFAAPEVKAPDTNAAAQVVTDPEKIVVPRDAGMVKSKFTGNSGRLIVHIQDAHCNYEAQTNIVKILENLIKNDKLSLISVEGADGPIDTSWFKAFPDDEVRKEVADYFMKKGEITGPEFLSITSNYPIKLYGAETRAYYIQNLNAFTSSYPMKEPTEKYLNQIKTILNRLKGFIYSDDLKLMDARYVDYEAKKLAFNDYVKFLQSEAEKARINLREYDNFFKLISVLIYEKKIDFTVTDKERGALIDDLSREMPKDKLSELVGQSVAFKVGKISSVDFYSYIKKLAMEQGIDLQKKYPNLYNYIIYNSVYSKIENEKLFNDIKKIETAIKEKLFQNDDQRQLEKLSRHVEMLLGLINIKLLNADFEYYKANKDEFAHQVFADFIKAKTVQYGLAYNVEDPSEDVSNAIPKLEEFYVMAVKRDNALVENTLKAMNKEDQKLAVLITGGFHSEGITKLLEKQGVSYMVICPSITKDVPTPYIQILTNQRTPLEDIITSSAKNQQSGKDSMLAPPPIMWASGLKASDFAELLNGQALRLQVKEFNTDWDNIYLTGTRADGSEVTINIGKVSRKIANYADRARKTAGAKSKAEILQDFVQHVVANDRGSSAEEKTRLLSILTEVVDRIEREDFEMQDDAARRARASGEAPAAPDAVRDTPGKHAILSTTVSARPFSDEYIRGMDKILGQSYAEGTWYSVSLRDLGINHLGNFKFIVHVGLEARIEKYNNENGINIPTDWIHPGRGGYVAGISRGQAQAHISAYRFEGLKDKLSHEPRAFEEAIARIAKHELAHIELANERQGIVQERFTKAAEKWPSYQKTRGSDEEAFVDTLVDTRSPETFFVGKSVRAILAIIDAERQQLDQVYRWEEVLLLDDAYGTTAREEIVRMHKEGKYAELRRFVTDNYNQRLNIDRQRNALSGRPYRGYKDIMVLSSTPSTAAFKKLQLDKLFRGLGEVNIISQSTGSFDELGQIMGIVVCLQQEDELQNGALKRHLEQDDIDLAIYPDAGLAERFIPMTFALDEQRGWQDLLGTFPDARGNAVKAKLITGVMLNTAAFAQNDGRQGFTDVYWTSQQIASTIPHETMQRTGFQFQKFLVPIDWDVDEQVLAGQLWQFGTAVVSENGELLHFYGNQTDGAAKQVKDQATGVVTGYSIDNTREVYRTLRSAGQNHGVAAFDFGSLSISNDMLLALWKYWREKTDTVDGKEINRLNYLRDKARTTGFTEAERKTWKRDVDGDFTQPLTFLLQAINKDAGLLAEIERSAASLREAKKNTDAKYKKTLNDAIGEINKKLADENLADLRSKIYRKYEPQQIAAAEETMEFLMLNYDNPLIFGDLHRVAGSIKLGANADWQTYRTAFSAMNDKLFHLTGLLPGRKMLQINEFGDVVKGDDGKQKVAGARDALQAENGRRRAGISNDRVCDFNIGDTHFVLSKDQVFGKEPWIYKLPDGKRIVIHNSIVQNCTLYPGSTINNSVVEDSKGTIAAQHSYVQRCLVRQLNAYNSMAHTVIDDGRIKVVGRIVTDIFRPGIKDSRFPDGQTRFSVPMNYFLTAKDDNKKAIGDNRYSADEIRKMECDVDKNADVERKIREAIESRVAAIPAKISARMERYNYCKDNIKLPKFGTSGLRDKNANLSDMAVYLTTQGLIDYLQDLKKRTEDLPAETRDFIVSGAIDKVADIVLAGDLRPSTQRILRAIAAGILSNGCKADYIGRQPTPLMAYYAFRKMMTSFMTTGSHIPLDENGVKPNRLNGEFLKEEEKIMMGYRDRAAQKEFYLTWDETMFDKTGMFRTDLPAEDPRAKLIKDAAWAVNDDNPEVQARSREAVKLFSDRYSDCFGRCLENIPDKDGVLFWSHSGVGRDAYPLILEKMGLNVLTVDRWDVPTDEKNPFTGGRFLTLDTEDVKEEFIEMVKDLMIKHKRRILVTTDGDGDRPAVFFMANDGKVIFIPGDKLGVLVGLLLKPEFFATPVTANPYAFNRLVDDVGTEMVATDVGSPHIARAEFLYEKNGLKNVAGNGIGVMGNEVNGGLLVGNYQIPEGLLKAVRGWNSASSQPLGEPSGKLKSLVTRDSMLPIISTLLLTKVEGKTLADLYVEKFSGDKYQAETLAGLVENVSKDQFTKGLREGPDSIYNYEKDMGPLIAKSFTPKDAKILQVYFDADGVKYINKGEKEKDKRAADQALSAEATAIKDRLEQYLKQVTGLERERIVAINFQNGIRSFFSNGEIIHFRASSNSAQFRGYPLARSRPMDLTRVKQVIDELSRDIDGNVPKTGHVKDGPGILVQIIRDYISQTANAVAAQQLAPDSSRITPGSFAMAAAMSGFDAKVFITRIVLPGGSGGGLGGFFGGPEDGYLGNFAAIVNTVQQDYDGYTQRGEIPAIAQFYKAAAVEALKVPDVGISRGLQTMAGVGLAILNLRAQDVKGIETVTLTTNPKEMIPAFKHKTLGGQLSYINPGAMPVAPKDGADGIFFRGWEGIGKLGDNIMPEAVYDQGVIDTERRENRMVMYVMLHVGGFNTTVFLHDNLPGSIQHTSTGPGHLQARSVDIKYVTKGSGIQWIKVTDEKGDIVRVFAQALFPGVWVRAIPGTIDSVENLGGLEFNDISVPLRPVAAQEIASLAGAGVDNPASSVVPYHTVNINAANKYVRNPAVSDKLEVELVRSFLPLPGQTLLDIYATDVTTDKDTANITPRTLVALKVLDSMRTWNKGPAPVSEIVTPADVAAEAGKIVEQRKDMMRMEEVLATIKTAMPFAARAGEDLAGMRTPAAGLAAELGVKQVTQDQIDVILGNSRAIMAELKVNASQLATAVRLLQMVMWKQSGFATSTAEITMGWGKESWRSSTFYNDKGKTRAEMEKYLSLVEGSLFEVAGVKMQPVTLRELLAAMPELGGQAYNETPVFTKILETNYEPVVYAGFKENVDKDQFVGWLKQEPVLTQRLFGAMREGLDKAQVEEFKRRYGAWASAQAAADWTLEAQSVQNDAAMALQDYLKPGKSQEAASILEEMRANRKKIVSNLNRINLKGLPEGTSILCPTDTIHAIFGLSLQVHGPMNDIGTEKNEAWVITMRNGKIVLEEPQQVSNTTLSIADFFTPIDWVSGRAVIRKPNMAADIDSVAGYMKFTATPEESIVLKLPQAETLGRGAERVTLIDRPEWPYFRAASYRLSGAAGQEASAAISPVKEAPLELSAFGAPVTVKIGDRTVTVENEGTYFVPAGNILPIEISSAGKSELRVYSKPVTETLPKQTIKSATTPDKVTTTLGLTSGGTTTKTVAINKKGDEVELGKVVGEEAAGMITVAPAKGAFQAIKLETNEVVATVRQGEFASIEPQGIVLRAVEAGSEAGIIYAESEEETAMATSVEAIRANMGVIKARMTGHALQILMTDRTAKALYRVVGNPAEQGKIQYEKGAVERYLSKYLDIKVELTVRSDWVKLATDAGVVDGLTREDVVPVAWITQAEMDDLKGDEVTRNKIAKELRAMPISNTLISTLEKGKGNFAYWRCVRELEANSLILAAANTEDIDSRNAIAFSLLRVMNTLVDKRLDSIDDLKPLMPGPWDPLVRFAGLIKKLLITRPMQAFKPDAEIHGRRQLLWSA